VKDGPDAFFFSLNLSPAEEKTPHVVRFSAGGGQIGKVDFLSGHDPPKPFKKWRPKDRPGKPQRKRGLTPCLS
jgi:hypothetical protein